MRRPTIRTIRRQQGPQFLRRRNRTRPAAPTWAPDHPADQQQGRQHDVDRLVAAGLQDAGQRAVVMMIWNRLVPTTTPAGMRST